MPIWMSGRVSVVLKEIFLLYLFIINQLPSKQETQKIFFICREGLKATRKAVGRTRILFENCQSPDKFSAIFLQPFEHFLGILNYLFIPPIL
jgi:hypothetical protein